MDDVHFREHSESVEHFIAQTCSPGEVDASAPGQIDRHGDGFIYYFGKTDFNCLLAEYAKSTAYPFERDKPIPTSHEYIQGYNNVYQTRLNPGCFTCNHSMIDGGFNEDMIAVSPVGGW